MINIGSHLLASAYPATASMANTAGTVCTINGRPCESYDFFNSIFATFGIFMVFWILVAILMIVSMWKVYQKAGKPGWASIIPIYNYIVLLEIVGRPTWWILLFFVPFVNIIFIIIVYNDLAKSFGQNVGFTLGLIFLPFIFYPMLAFGNYTYGRIIFSDQPSAPVTPV